MSIENKLRCELNEYVSGIVFPEQLDTRIRNSYKSWMENKHHTGMRGNRKIITVMIAAFLLIPSAAMAFNFFLADEFYGSFDQLKKKVAAATMENYMRLNAKLSMAKGELGEEEYEEFKKMLKVISSAKLEYGDKNGNVDYEQLPSDKVAEIKNAMVELMPVFDHLNHVKSSKEILTTNEFDKYIEALMTIETVQAKIGTSGWIDPNKLPVELRDEYKEAWHYMQNVYDKQEGRIPLNIDDISYAVVDKVKLSENGVPEIGPKSGKQESDSRMIIYNKSQVKELFETIPNPSGRPQYHITFYSAEKKIIKSMFIDAGTAPEFISDKFSLKR